MSELLEKCKAEEEKFQFPSFSQTDAKRLGDLLYEKSLQYDRPVAIEITYNHLAVYRFFPDGTTRNNEVWLRAKRNTVDLMGMSSLHYKAQMQETGETLKDNLMPEMEYAACGGGFPLRIRGCGMVGTICTSGLADMEDHQVIIDALEEYFRGLE